MGFKKYVKVGLVSLAICAMSMPAIKVNADEVNSSNSTSGSVQINLNNPESSYEVSEAMNYDEFVEFMSENENISIEKAKDIIGEETLVPYNKAVEQIAEKQNISTRKARTLLDEDQLVKTSAGVQVSTNQYRTLSRSITVTSTYKPKINWYCLTSESGSFYGIKKVLNTSLNRGYGGISKTFSGYVYTRLENSYTIYYILNGDFYNNGTVSFSGGASDIAVGSSAKLSCSVSYSTSHYKYCYADGRLKWGSGVRQ